MDRTSQGLKIVIRNSDGTFSDITMYSDDGRMPSTIEIGGGMKTADLEISEIENTDDEPLIKKQSVDGNDSGAPSKKTQWVTIYSTIQEILTALCALVTSVIMIMTLVKFFSTSHVAGAWPTNPKLYPTYILLTTSLITLIIDVFSLGERYCSNASKANVDKMVSKMRYALLIFQAIGSATGAGVFKGTEAAGSGQDLFSWTCSSAADAMGSVNSSDLICNSSVGLQVNPILLYEKLTYTLQKNSSILSILQTCLHGLGIIITVVTMLAPKEDSAKDNNDEEAGAKTNKEDKKSSCASCGKTTSNVKLNEKKPVSNNEKPNNNTGANGTELEPNGPQVNIEATKSLVNQSQGLYTRLQQSENPQDLSYNGEPHSDLTQENHYNAQTGYANTKSDTREVTYYNYDMQGFP